MRKGLWGRVASAAARLATRAGAAADGVRAPGAPAPEIGSSGLEGWHGRPPQDWLPELMGARGLRVYREMRDNVGIIDACLQYTTRLVSRVTLHYVPAAADPRGAYRREFVTGCLADMAAPLRDLIADDWLSMLEYGFAPCEILFKRRLGDVNDGRYRSRYTDGLYGIRSVALRPQEDVARWEIDETGGVHGFWQRRRGGGEVLIPVPQMLLFRTTRRGNTPWGRSVLRSAYNAYWYLTELERLEAMRFERDAAGAPVYRLPASFFAEDASANQKAAVAAAKQILEDLRASGEWGVVRPSEFNAHGRDNYGLDLLLGRGSLSGKELIDRYTREIAMAMMMDFVLLGHEGKGGYNMVESRSSLYGQALEGWVTKIVEPLNSWLLPGLFAANGWPTAWAGMIEAGPVEDVPLAALGDYVSKIVPAGVEMFAELEDRLLAAARLPRRPRPAAAA